VVVKLIEHQQNSLLAICIPTYNHAEPLRKCLEGLIPQTSKYNIPIYISDNASMDNTKEVIAQFKKEYPFLFYKRNPENLGVDINMLNAVHMASTKYVWALGARRIILPSILEKIYDILSKENLDLLILNDLNPTFFVPKTQAYNSAHKVFRDLNRNLTGLGFQILPKEAWDIEIAKKYSNTDWTVFGIALEYIANKSDLKAYFLSEPVATSSGASKWLPRTYQIWTSWKKVVKSLPSFYSDEEKEFIIQKSVNYFFGGKNFNLIERRSQGIYNAKVFEELRQDLIYYGKISPTVAYVIAKFPTLPLKLYYRTYAFARTFARLFIHQNAALNPNTRHAKRLTYA
jgi:abequosyltransferase